MKRIIRTEEVVDFFLSDGIEKLSSEEIWNIANKMIKKQNEQTEKDNKECGFAKYDLLKNIKKEKELKKWIGLKEYINEKLKGMEHLFAYKKKNSGVYSRVEIMQMYYLSQSKYYEMLGMVYEYAEKYIYYNRLISI